MKNIEVEIQIKVKEPKKIENKLKKIGKFVGERKQRDVYYVTSSKNFFAEYMPTEYLRVRYEDGKNHVNYSNLRFDKKGWLVATDEYETKVEHPETVEEIFKKIGLIPKVTVIKNRKYFQCGDFEVTLDEVDNLGSFMEVEAKKDFGGEIKTRKACEQFLKDLKIEYELTKDCGYPRLLYRKLNN